MASSVSSGALPLPTPDAAYVVPLTLNNERVPSKSGKTFDVVSPLNSQKVWSAAAANVEDARAAVQAAQDAFPAWSKTKSSERRKLFNAAADLLEERRSYFEQLQVFETGAGRGFAGGFNIDNGAWLLRETAGRCSTIEGSIPESSEDGTITLVTREPYGVVVGMAAWNAAVLLGLRAFVAAVGAGNTVVFKASEYCPRTHEALGQLFIDAGFPPGVLNVIQHTREDAPAVVEALVAHPAVQKVNFTGSTVVGSIIGKLCGQYIKPVLLELGGKSPCVVLEDADLDKAAESALLGSWLHQGQICMSTDRIIVVSSVASEFKQKLAQAAKRLSLPAGPLCMPNGVTKVQALVEDAVSKGAMIDLEQESPLPRSDAHNTAQRLVWGVRPDMDLYHNETFGPIASVVVAKDEEDAVRIANDTEYGLTSSVWSKDLSKALGVAKKIQAGAVHINSMTVHDEMVHPHGGWKKSGFGRFGPPALVEFTQTKTITFKYQT